ncbi:MAG: hypothetical protein HYU77_05840 [Betaproteobacteria bacterium]|nr:hypothetical protein [Betaproteobacteria bacterium]
MNTRQTGATLLITLIMLVVLTLFVLSALNISGLNLRIAGNMQMRSEAQAAAQAAIESVLSSVTGFTAGTATTQTVTVAGKNYSVSLDAPACLSIKAAPGYSALFQIGGVSSAPQDTTWDVRAEVSDTTTGAKVVVHQGVRIRLPAGATCPG